MWLATFGNTGSAGQQDFHTKTVNIAPPEGLHFGYKNMEEMSKKRSSNEIEDETEIKKIKLNTGFWANGLLEAMKDPRLIVQEDDLVVIINDKFPKAEHHYLVMPKENIASLKAVDKTHLKLLKYMHKIGKKLAAKHEGVIFKMGYHTEPSMAHLHLHVISEDMDSICLKSKRHWNSYTSAFFMNSKEVMKSLENDEIKYLTSAECTELLKAPLKCHKCDFVAGNMPKLKKHLREHFPKNVT